MSTNFFVNKFFVNKQNQKTKQSNLLWQPYFSIISSSLQISSWIHLKYKIQKYQMQNRKYPHGNQYDWGSRGGCLSYLYLWKSFCPRSEVHQIPAAPKSFHTALFSDSTHFYSFLLIFTQNLLSITHFYLFQILLISTHFRLFLVLLSSTFQILHRSFSALHLFQILLFLCLENFIL